MRSRDVILLGSIAAVLVGSVPARAGYRPGVPGDATSSSPSLSPQDTTGLALARLTLAVREARVDSIENDWFGGERRKARSADIEALARSSDAIVIAEFPTCPPRTWWKLVPGSDDEVISEFDTGPPCGSFVRVLEWLRATRADESDSLIGVYLGMREDSLRRNWAPTQQESRATPADSRRRFVAFLRLASDRTYRETMRNYRPTDFLNGFLVADDTTLARVRRAVARPDERLRPRPGCSASLTEFTGLDSTTSACVGIKLSRTTPREWRSHLWSLVVGTQPLHTSWFAPCLRPDDAYEFDFFHSETAHVGPARMKALLDSLGVVRAIRGQRSNDSDTLTITFRRVTGGGERILECSLDWNAYREVARILAGPSRNRRIAAASSRRKSVRIGT